MFSKKRNQMLPERNKYDTPAICLFIFLLLSCTVHASQKYGTVKGKVIDQQTGAPLSNTNIILIGEQRGAAANKNGEFIIYGVPAGELQLKASHIGYKSTVKNITIQPETEVFVQFKLQEDFFLTEQIVVTATRTQNLLSNVPVITELITQNEIAQKGSEDLSDILEDRPGIAIESSVSGGKFLYMNGIDSKRILLLVDGIPLSGKINDRNVLNLIDADKIDHIEIVKGPGSALYGSEAMGGVVNIITRGFSDGFKIDMSGRIGSADLYSGNISFSGTKNNLGYALNFDHFREGFDKGATEIDIKDTESNRVHGKIKMTHTLLGHFELGSEYKEDVQHSETDFRGAQNDNQSKVKNFNTNIGWEKSLLNHFGIQLSGYHTRNLRTYASTAQNSNMISSVDSTKDHIWGLKSDVSFTPNKKLKFDFGFDFSDHDYDSERLIQSKKRKLTGIFSQIEAKFLKNLVIILGTRYDKITDLEGHFNPRLSGMYSFSDDLKIRAALGTGFRAPSFIELYSNFPMPIPGVPLKVLGNKELKPETSIGGNFGIEYCWNQFLQVNATFFRNQFKDMIVDYQADRFTFSYLNVQQADFTGFEFQGRIRFFRNFNATISYNYTDIDQKDEDVAFSKISPHTALIRINYSLFKNKFKVSLRDQLFSKRNILVYSVQTGEYATQPKSAYHLLNLTFSYAFNELFTIRLGVKNLTDYVDDYGPWIGRRIFLGIDTSFQRQ